MKSVMALAGIVLCASASSATAAVLHVPDEYPDIRSAIAAADHGDEIVVADGVYTGPNNRDIGISGSVLTHFTLRSENGADSTIIDCEGATKFLKLVGGVSSETLIEGFTIANGLAETGGAILCSDSSPVIRDCVFSGCVATGDPLTLDGGGAIFSLNGSPLLDRCVFQGNSSNGGAGGAVMARGGGTFTVTDCEFLLNQALVGGGLLLGDVDDDSLVHGCLFEGNRTFELLGGAGGGAAAFVLGGSPRISSCTFLDNASDLGGAIIVANLGTDPVFVNCLFVANSALPGGTAGGLTPGEGGALYMADSTAARLINCTVVQNSATGRGGGLASSINGAPSVLNCVFWNNAAKGGHELAVIGFLGIPSSLSVAFSNIEGGEDHVDLCDGCSLEWDDSNIAADPRFADPSSGDFAIGAGSPSIDAGNNLLVPPGITTDLAGNPRFRDDPGTPDTGEGGNAPSLAAIVDMGAYEFQGVTPCATDFDVSGKVDLKDLILLLRAWGPCAECAEDLDGDGVVGLTDLLPVLRDWGVCPVI